MGRYLTDEAVEIDGGQPWDKMRQVTLPMVTPTILFNLILSVIGAMQTFVQSYVITDGDPYNASPLPPIAFRLEKS